MSSPAIFAFDVFPNRFVLWLRWMFKFVECCSCNESRKKLQFNKIKWFIALLKEVILQGLYHEELDSPCSFFASAVRFFIVKLCRRFSETLSATDRFLKFKRGNCKFRPRSNKKRLIIINDYSLCIIKTYMVLQPRARLGPSPSSDGCKLSVSFSWTSKSAFSSCGTFRSMSWFVDVVITSSLIGLPFRISGQNNEILSHLPYKSNIG